VQVAASLSSADVRKIAAQRRRYLAAQPARVRRLLKGIRTAITDAVPQAVEVFTYGLAPQLAKFEMSKGTVRFPLDKPVPMRLVTQLAKARAAEIRRPD
jgi:uncharacterized protein YdhG (YjbR/CyaY superfamily)